MNELWYTITTPDGTIETRDYKWAQDAKAMGHRVAVEYRYKNLDHVEPDAALKEKRLTILGY